MSTIDDILALNNMSLGEQRKPVKRNVGIQQLAQNNADGQDGGAGGSGGNAGAVGAGVAQPKTWADMINLMYPHKMPTQDEVAEQKKRQERQERFSAVGDAISALANLYMTSRGSENAFDPNNSMSARTKARWDRMNKERDEQMRGYIPLYMQARQNDEANQRYQEGKERQAMLDQREEQRYKEGKERQDRLDQQNEQRYQESKEWQKSQAEQAQTNWKEQFEESKRRARAQEAIARDRANNAAGSGGKTKGQEITLGSGRKVFIPNEAYNESNIAAVFETLPEQVKYNATHEQVYSSTGRPRYENGIPVMKEKTISKEEMLRVIGQYMETVPEVQAAWLRVGGKIQQDNAGGQNGEEDPFAQWAVPAGGDKSGDIDWEMFVTE